MHAQNTPVMCNLINHLHKTQVHLFNTQGTKQDKMRQQRTITVIALQLNTYCDWPLQHKDTVSTAWQNTEENIPTPNKKPHREHAHFQGSKFLKQQQALMKL